MIEIVERSLTVSRSLYSKRSIFSSNRRLNSIPSRLDYSLRARRMENERNNNRRIESWDGIAGLASYRWEEIKIYVYIVPAEIYIYIYIYQFDISIVYIWQLWNAVFVRYMQIACKTTLSFIVSFNTAENRDRVFLAYGEVRVFLQSHRIHFNERASVNLK